MGILAVTLTARRRQAEKLFLTQSAIISRAREGDADAYGAIEHRLEVVANDVPARAQKAQRPQRLEEGMQHIAVADWEVLLPTTVEVALSDLIKIDNYTYEVRGSDAGVPEALVTTAYCTRKN